MFDQRVCFFAVAPWEMPQRFRDVCAVHRRRLGQTEQLIKEQLCPAISGNYVRI